MGMTEFSTPSLTKKNSFDDRHKDEYRESFQPRSLKFSLPEQNEPLIRVADQKEIVKQLTYSEKVNTNPDAHFAAKFKIVKKRALNRGRNPSAAKDTKMKRYKEKYQQKKRKLTEALERAETSSELSGPEKSYTLAQNLPIS